MAVIDRKERFATEGMRFQRNNGDNTVATPQRFLGFANNVDLSGVPLTAGSAVLHIKVDHNPVTTVDVMLDDLPDLTAVTVNEIIGPLTAATTGIEWTMDARTTRLRGSIAGSGRVIQIWGPLAAALDFGQSLRHGGDGLRVISFFNDETVSIGLPKDIQDKEEIDIEGAKGTVTRMVIGARMQGMSPVFTSKVKDYLFLVMAQGGTLDLASGTYRPPLSNESDHPSFWGEIFSPIYGDGTNKMSDMAGYERLFLYTMMGTEGDIPIEAKAWATYAMNMTATEYVNETGERLPAWEEQTLSLEQFDALRLLDIDAPRMAA